ncbi:MAG: hypothetical protein AAGE03_06230 [Pseudomonadota bacterium]
MSWFLKSSARLCPGTGSYRAEDMREVVEALSDLRCTITFHDEIA